MVIGVHDAKPSTSKHALPRVSLVHRPRSKRESVSWKPLTLAIAGAGDPSVIWRAAAACPAGRGCTWPVPVKNVEATELVQVGRLLLFRYAERATAVAKPGCAGRRSA
jgi:hypothetical protein